MIFNFGKFYVLPNFSIHTYIRTDMHMYACCTGLKASATRDTYSHAYFVQREAMHTCIRAHNATVAVANIHPMHKSQVHIF